MAIIGLPASGKTTLFDALTGRRDEPGTYAAPGSVHVGVVPIDDERVDFLAGALEPKKHTYASLEFVDIGGLFSGERANPDSVSAMREADGLVKVVRAFANDAVPHRKGSVDPRRDLEEMDADLFVVDLDIIERRIETLHHSVTKPTPKQEEEKAELALLQRCREQLESVGALDRLDVTAEERRQLAGFTFLTQKPGIVVLNIGEEAIGDEAAPAALGPRREPVLAVCAEIEKEILDLEPDERGPFLADLGLAELTEHRIVEACLHALGLITFFTSNEKELRAWLLPRGSTAVEAAGKIHTDLARGFIRAEVAACDDVRELGSWKELRAKGRLRLEGKDYVVQDGDILQIRFSV
jgi:GTP-binding protein YchF